MVAMHQAMPESTQDATARRTLKARIRAKVEHPFRVIKRQFGVCEGALPRADEEHGATAHTVRALQSLAGAAPTFAEYAGVMRLQRAQGPRWGLERPRNRPRWH